MLKQLGHRRSQNLVAGVFQGIDLHAVIQDRLCVFHVPQAADDHFHLGRGLVQKLGLLNEFLLRGLDLVQGHPDGGGLRHIQDAVHLVDQGVDVFAVDGRQERGVHLLIGAVGDDIGLMLDLLELRQSHLEGIVVKKHVQKKLGAFHDLVRQLFKEVIEFFFSRNESHRPWPPCPSPRQASLFQGRAGLKHIRVSSNGLSPKMQ